MKINDFGVKLINIKELSHIDGGKNFVEWYVWYVGYMFETYSQVIDNIAATDNGSLAGSRPFE